MNNRKKYGGSIFLIALLLIVIFWMLNNISFLGDGLSQLMSILSPFIYGFVLFFIVNIVVKIIEKYLLKLNRGRDIPGLRFLSIILSFGFYALMIAILVFLVIPDLQETFSYFISVVPGQVNNLINQVIGLIENNPQLIEYAQEANIDWNQLQSQLINNVRGFATGFLSSFLSYIPSLIGSIIDLSVTLIFSIFLLVSNDAIIRHIKKIIYGLFDLKWANYIVNFGRRTNKIFSGFVAGQLITGMLTGLLLYIIMLIFGFPYKLSIAVITAVTSLIPFYGPIFGGALGVILIAVVNFQQALWFAVLIVVVQQIEGNILYPNVMGDTTGLPGIWVMVVVTVGGAIFGIPGMFLSVPLASLAYQFVAENINYRLQKNNLKIDTDTYNVEQ